MLSKLDNCDLNKEIENKRSIKGKKLYLMLNRFMMLIILIISIVVFTSLSPFFLSLKNFYAVGLTISVLGIVCIGQTLCILVRGFDLSVGYVAAFCGIMVAYMTQRGIPYFISLPLALIIGAIIGMLNGFLITKLKVNPLITTLATGNIFYGGLYIVSKGFSIIVDKPIFDFLGTTKIFGIPLPLIILIGLYLVFYIILRNTLFGRYVYCVGGNPEAAKIAGLNIDRIQIKVYILSSLLAAFAGIILASRMGAAQTTVGSSYALDSVAAAVLGGTVLTGGRGNILGTLIGVAIIGILQNGLVMINMPSYYQYVATGLVLIIAVVLQNINKK